ncbi:MAG: shikimate dehydrogenase [Melioribacteraceae bacterium]|nr:shikimate dehydrogenase [Melioribacteraceae bacterium]MCO6473072.1 shikimate dehydrogenase [Melioribacteraceae bacterium]MDD3558021.1 shikimate dehydrogenase [Melioribacteraceae bacterium]
MNSLNKFNHNTTVVGVIGHPIKHSFSPLMHNISFELNDLKYVYLPFDILQSNLEDAMKGMVALGIKGFNVTLPYKEKIIELLNEISEESTIIGAVNTIVNDNGKLIGYNTDVHGVLASLTPYKEEITDKTVTVIGAGGSARSTIFALIRNFKVKKINLVNRTAQKAESLRDYFAAKMLYKSIKSFELVPPDLVDVFAKSKLIINTTSVGMFPDIDDSPTTIAESFNNKQIVFDLIYNPLKTKFLKLAASKGAKTINGLTMFVEQGAKSFELWTGEEMPVDKIKTTIKSYLEQ